MREIVLAGRTITPIHVGNALTEIRQSLSVTRGIYFLVAISYSLEAPVSFVVPVVCSFDHLSIRMYQLGSQWTDICGI